MEIIKKNPIIAAVSAMFFTALGFTAVCYILSLIKKTTFAAQFDTFMIIACVLCSVINAVQSFMKAKKAAAC